MKLKDFNIEKLKDGAYIVIRDREPCFCFQKQTLLEALVAAKNALENYTSKVETK